MPDPQTSLIPGTNQPETMIPMIDPNGNTGSVPQSQVQAALKAGGRIGVRMTAPDGTKGTIPIEHVSDAVKAGGILPGGNSTEDEKQDAYEKSNPGFLQRVSHAYDQVASGVKGINDMAVKPAIEAISEPFRELGTTDDEDQAQADAAEAHKQEVYHKASADFHKGMANNDSGSILNAGKDLLELFTNDYKGADPNNLLANMASAAIRGAEAEHAKSSEHTTKVVAAVKDAATRYGNGDREGAIKTLSTALSEASQALGHGVAAALPLIGPAAAKAGEDVSGPNPSYGAGEVLGLLGPSALHETGAVGELGTAVKNALPESITSPVSTLASKATGAVGDAAMGAAKYVARKAGQAAPAAASAAVSLGKEFAGGVVDSLADSASNVLQKIQEPGANAIATLKEARDSMLQQLSDAKIPIDKAQALVDKISNAVQDKYYELTLPGVGGGSTDATGAAGFGDQVRQMAADTIGPRATGATRVSAANRVGKAVGVTYGAPEAMPDRAIDSGTGFPKTQQPGPDVNPKTGDYRTNFSRVAAEEQARGNPAPVFEGGTFGEKVGGIPHAVERVLRTVPTIGRGISEGIDAPHMEVARKVIDQAVKSLHPEELSGQGLQKLVQNVHDSAGKTLEDTLTGITSSNPGVRLEMSDGTRNGLTGLSKLFPLTEPAVTEALANPTLDNIARVRGLITEYAGDAGREGQTAWSVGNKLDGEIKATLQRVNPEAAEQYQAAASHVKAVAGSFGTGALRAVIDSDGSAAYDQLLHMTSEQYARTMKQLTTGTSYGPSYAPRIEQGLMRRIIESAPAEASGPMKLRSLGMEKMLYKNRGKFSPQTFDRFKDLVGADGYLGTIEKDMNRTSTRGVAAEHGAATTALVGATLGALTGHTTGALIGAGTGLLAHYGMEAFARVFMTKTGQIQFSNLAKLAADLHPTSDKVAYAKQLTKSIESSLDKAKKASAGIQTQKNAQ